MFPCSSASGEKESAEGVSVISLSGHRIFHPDKRRQAVETYIFGSKTT